MPTAEPEPIDGAGKIDPSLFPVPSTLTSTLQARAAKLRTGGQNMQQTGDDIVLAWGGLTNCYTAPEAETLYAALDPLIPNGAVTGIATDRAARALEDFAETVHGIQASWRELKSEAYAFRAEIAEEGEDWDKGEGWFGFGDSSNVDKNDALLLRAANLVEDFKEAEVACANKINIGIDGRTDFLSEDDLGGEMPDANQFVHGAGVELEEIPTSWGEAAASTDHGWARDVGDAIWDFGAGAVEGTGAMLGAHSSEGWLKQSWGDSLKEYHWDNLTSAASLVGMYDAESDSLGWSGLDSAGEAWKDLAHSVVPWEEWGDRPGYVIGTALLNIGSVAVGAALTATGVGAVVGVPLMAWRGAAILDGMGGSGRGGSGVDVPNLPDMPTYGGAGAPVVNVDASNFTPAQAAQVTASLDRLNASTSGSGGSSSSNESTSGGGGRSGQNASASNESSPNQAKKTTSLEQDADTESTSPDNGAKDEASPARSDSDESTESTASQQRTEEATEAPETSHTTAEDPNQYPRTQDAARTEKLFQTLEASYPPEQKARMEGYAKNVAGRDTQAPDWLGEFQERELAPAGGGRGPATMTAERSSEPFITTRADDIGPLAPNDGRLGNEPVNNGPGNNNPNLRDHSPTAFNQGGSGPSTGRDVSSGNSQVGHFEASNRGENPSSDGSRNGDQTTGGNPQTPNGTHAASGRSAFHSQEPLSVDWKKTQSIVERGNAGPGVNDGARLIRPESELVPKNVKAGDAGFSPHPNERFGDGDPLSPDAKYVVEDKKGNYRGTYITDGNGEIGKIDIKVTDFSQKHPEFKNPRSNVEYLIEAPNSNYRYETNLRSRNLESEGQFASAKSPRMGGEEHSVKKAAKEYFDAYNKMLQEDFSRSPEKYPGLTEAPQYESVTWNGGHVVGIGEFGGMPERLNQVAMLQRVNQHSAAEWRVSESYRNYEEGMDHILRGDFDRLYARASHFDNERARGEYLAQVELWEKAYQLSPPPPDIRAKVSQIYDPSLPEFEVRNKNGSIARILDAPPAAVVLQYSINGVPQGMVQYKNHPTLK